LDVKDEDGERRLDLKNDFVATEIAAALVRRDIRIIPVLVEGARMPKDRDLPERLRLLVRRHGVSCRHEHFGRDAEALINAIKEAPL
jgi:hypothetical protein